MKSIPCNTVKNKPPLYILDSNACLEFSRFYYDGKCSSNSHVQFIKNILIEAQNNGGSFQFEWAISELSFDYGSNSINSKMAQQLYFGIDSLITNISAKELLTYTGSIGKPYHIERNSHCNIYSILDCNFPKALIRDDKLVLLFFLSYLYRLKIQELYQTNHIDPIKKVENLFSYMIDIVGVFGDIEFQLGKMLFLNQNNSKTIKKLLKVDNVINVPLLINTVTDIVFYRISRKIGNDLLAPVFFITDDSSIQELFSANKIVLESNIGPNISMDCSEVNQKYYDDFQKYYVQNIYPTMKKRFISSYDINSHRLDIANTLYSEIKELEKIVITKV